MSAKKRGLGSGLDTLLGVTKVSEEIETSQEEVAQGKTEAHQASLLELPIDQIQRGQYQPRRYFDEEALNELAESIKEQGLLQPIVVRTISKGAKSQKESKYEIIAGERRWRASQIAGLHSIPVLIKELDDKSTIAVALIENLQREDLNPMEEAYALSRLKEEFELTHDQVAKAVGKSRSTVTNFLRLTSLSESVRHMVENTDLEMGHARALLSLEANQQKAAADQIVEKAMSVRQAEALVRNFGKASSKKGKATTAKPDADIQRLEQQLSEKIGAAASIQHKSNGKGKLIISYNSSDELEGILSFFKLK